MRKELEKKLRGKKNKGFTLAELLIVVAIIAVLVAISIPIFRAQLRRSTLATNQANARSAYAAATADYLVNSDGTSSGIYKYDIEAAKAEPVAAAAGSATNGTVISEWTLKENVDGSNPALGDSVYKVWYVTFDTTTNEGSVTAFNYE